jgi:hypothetical protein
MGRQIIKLRHLRLAITKQLRLPRVIISHQRADIHHLEGGIKRLVVSRWLDIPRRHQIGLHHHTVAVRNLVSISHTQCTSLVKYRDIHPMAGIQCQCSSQEERQDQACHHKWADLEVTAAMEHLWATHHNKAICNIPATTRIHLNNVDRVQTNSNDRKIYM